MSARVSESHRSHASHLPPISLPPSRTFCPPRLHNNTDKTNSPPNVQARRFRLAFPKFPARSVRTGGPSQCPPSPHIPRIPHAPSIPEFFNAWCRHDGDLLELAARLNITPIDLLTLAKNPEFNELLHSWQALELSYFESHARTFRASAGDSLRDVMHKALDPAERRKSATTLARIGNTLVHGPTRRPCATDRPTSVPENPTGHGRSVPFVSSDQAGELTPNTTPTPVDVPDAIPLAPTSLGTVPDTAPSSLPPPPLTRADLVRRLVNAATLPAEIPPIVSLPPSPTTITTLAARLIKSAGARPKSAHSRDAPQLLTPDPLQRTMTNLLEIPQVA